MKILISSIIDIHRTAHSRLHQFIKHLSVNHEITVLCINDWWKSKHTNIDLYSKESDHFFGNVTIVYLTQRHISPILQELFSYNTIRNLKNIDEFDVHLNYNSLITGYLVSKQIDSNIYDIADDLPEMIRTSPQIPFFFKPFGAMLGSIMLQKNISASKKTLYSTNSLKEDYNFPQSKSEYIPNGVDTQLFKQYSSNELKSSLGIDDEFVIGFVGALREWVDLEPVFESLQQLSQHLKIKLLIVGEESHLDKNKKLARKYMVFDKVIFAGAVPYLDVPKYMSCMDICLIPFKKDSVSKNSLPLKLFEYMACEKPVISTRLPGVINAVGEKVQYASNASEFSDRISYLYHNKEVIQMMGVEGRKFVEKYYDWSVICSKIEKILEESAS
jgi:glycosyltransferase involved in cell wall biosynthesis